MKTKSFLLSIFYFFMLSCALVSCGGDDDDDKPAPPPTPVKELTFQFAVDNIKAHGADIKVVPSEKDRKYVADVAPASVFDNKGEEEIINMIISEADESSTFTGDMMFKADGMELEAETEYVLFAIGIEEGKAASRLARMNFKTAEEEIPVPTLSLTGVAGDAEGNNKHSQLMFSAKSDIADALLYVLADNAKEGQNLNDEAYVEKLINEKGKSAAADEIAVLNSAEGLTLSFEDLEAEHEYTFMARVSNKSGAVTQKLTLKTEAMPLPPKGPEILLTAQAGDENGNNKDSYLLFGLRCTTNDVYYAEMLVSVKEDVDKILAGGITLEQLASANKGNGLILTDEEINMVNTATYSLSLDNTDGVIPDKEYTCIALVENFEGTMSVARKDVKTEPAAEDDTAPTVKLEGRAGDADGMNKNCMVTFSASCTSKNASYAEAFVADTSFINDILQGMTLEELMTFNAGIGKVLEQNDLDILNTAKLTLTWDQMLGDTGYTLLFCVKTKAGKMVVGRCDVKTEPDPASANVVRTQGYIQGMLNAGNVVTERPNKITHLKYNNKVLLKSGCVKHSKGIKVGKLPGMFIDR